MTVFAFILNFLTFIALRANYQSAPPIMRLRGDEQKEAFTEAFMKYLNSSFYTGDFMEAFSAFRDGKAIIDKHYPELVQYKTNFDIPGKTSELINYILHDKKANVPFSSKYKEAAEARLDFEKNASWVREALGSSYVVREVNHENNPDYPAHYLYFYRAGVDTASKYAFHVEVAYMYSKSKKGSSNIVIYSQQKN